VSFNPHKPLPDETAMAAWGKYTRDVFGGSKISMPLVRINAPFNFNGLTTESTDAEIRSNPWVRKHYGAMLDKYPDHPVVLIGTDDARCLRWKANSIIELITGHKSSNRIDLNRLWADFSDGNYPIEDMATVYRMMGYSLSGFQEVFGDYIEGIW
jgi:hypothetical protein